MPRSCSKSFLDPYQVQEKQSRPLSQRVSLLCSQTCQTFSYHTLFPSFAPATRGHHCACHWRCTVLCLERPSSLVFLIKSPSFTKAHLTVTCPETLTPSLSPLVLRNISLCSHSSLSCSPYHTVWLLCVDFQSPRLHCELHSHCQDEALFIWSHSTQDRASNKANNHKMLNKWMKMITELIKCKGKVLSSQKNQYEATRGHIGNSLPRRLLT